MHTDKYGSEKSQRRSRDSRFFNGLFTTTSTNMVRRRLIDFLSFYICGSCLLVFVVFPETKIRSAFRREVILRQTATHGTLPQRWSTPPLPTFLSNTSLDLPCIVNFSHYPYCGSWSMQWPAHQRSVEDQSCRLGIRFSS